MKHMILLAGAVALAVAGPALAKPGNGHGNGHGYGYGAQGPVGYGAGGCPPGLAKKAIPCMPPGQAKKLYNVGQRLPRGYGSQLGYNQIPYDLRSRLMVVSRGARTLGLIVDAAREFLPIPHADIKPPPEAITGLSGKYLEGIATIKGRMILVLDLDEVIDIGEQQTAAGNQQGQV